MSWSLLCFDTVDSTNSWVKRHMGGLQENLTFVVARSQSAGRGRCGRSWISPDGNLYLTAVEPVKMKLPLYSKAAALAIKAVLTAFGIPVRVRWPNDLMVGNNKIAGILVEEASCQGKSLAIVGIGLNVNMDEKALQQIDRPATSMSSCLHKEFNLADVQQQLIVELSNAFKFACEHPHECHTLWADSCSWMVGGSSAPHAEGVVVKFLEDGGMCVKNGFGGIISVYSTQ